MGFKVKVTGSKYKSYWYAHRIGEIFEVDDLGESGDDSYNCVDDEHKGNYILKSDCEVVNEERGIVSKPGVSGAFTGDNRVDSLRRIQSMCQSDRDDSQELLRFKLDVLHTVIDGLYY